MIPTFIFTQKMIGDDTVNINDIIANNPRKNTQTQLIDNYTIT
jgi:hypothetical protein